MAAEPADLDAQPVVPRAGPAPRRTDAQDNHRRSGAQASHRPVAVHNRRRRHRGGRDEGNAGDDLTPSGRTRSVLPDPGGRTEMAVGLNSRPKEWSRPPEPHPPDAGCWCSRNKRRPYVSLIWCSTPSGHGNGLRPWIRNNGRRTAYEPLNLTLDLEHAHVSRLLYWSLPLPSLCPSITTAAFG